MVELLFVVDPQTDLELFKQEPTGKFRSGGVAAFGMHGIYFVDRQKMKQPVH
jgi:hypothetical protein